MLLTPPVRGGAAESGGPMMNLSQVTVIPLALLECWLFDPPPILAELFPHAASVESSRQCALQVFNNVCVGCTYWYEVVECVNKALPDI